MVGGPKAASVIYSESTSQAGVDGREMGGRGPTYEMPMDGQVAIKWIDGMDYIGALPLSWEDYSWDDDDEIRVMTHDEMQDHGLKNGLIFNLFKGLTIIV